MMLEHAARRYRLPAMPACAMRAQADDPATALALAIEQARLAVTQAQSPDAALARQFTDALARLIRDAMRPGSGDPALQAMVLRHHAPPVREYAGLAARAAQDLRRVLGTVHAIAHPARLRRHGADPLCGALARLHESASRHAWAELADTASALLRTPQAAAQAPLARSLTRLLAGPELQHLLRMDSLGQHEQVRQYRQLWARHGPAPGSAGATARGTAGQRRGAAVEALAEQALETLAMRLDQAGGGAIHRVVTSLRVPAALAGRAKRAKTEWDAVVLRQAPGSQPAWDVCLVLEAKASVDAATTDFPRLLRGLALLALARPDQVYPFAARQGTVPLRGASLAALPTQAHALAGTVLYCCDAPADSTPRLLGAASRMQLLSAPASLDYASTLAQGQPADPALLEPVWRDLLASPRWHAVLWQYPTLRQVRELMVHAADLQAAAESAQEFTKN
ncbi:3-deoxy-D-arabino-heptulosonate 7-phosphate synthase [Orrella sp. JC864]|uniref:3-deoxy-D-arabino-heptulosonate 7-phosphate synthase n=1 Tax=Orrella sp. JC864 TaxID=3120298 RepID=UPI00300B23C1